MKMKKLSFGLALLCAFTLMQSQALAAVYRTAATASGSADGSTWANAMAWTDAFAKAAAETGDNELWVLGDVQISAVPTTVAICGNLSVRGGFSGNESDPSERDANLRSTFTGNEAYNLFVVGIASGCSLAFERVLLTKAKSRAVDKSGAGTLSFSDSSVSWNGRAIGHNASAQGCGVYAKGAGELRLSSTRVEGNGPINYPENTGGGWGVYVESATRAFFDDCAFVTNGTKLGAQTDQYAGKHKGVALWANKSPVTVRNCLFAGNTPRCGQVAGTGGTVFLEGACGSSAFSNTVFSGNHELLGHGAVDGGGTLRINLDSASSRVDMSGCTFAYNLSQTRDGSAGVSLVKGTLDIVDSTFFHNMLGWSEARDRGSDIHVYANGALSVSRTRLTSPVSSVSQSSGASVSVDSATMSYGDPHFATTALDCENLLDLVTRGNYPAEFHYKNASTTFEAIASFDTTVRVPAPSKPDVGAGNILYVKADASGVADGSSWADAFTDLGSALEAVSAAKNEIWIAGDLAPAADAEWVYVENDVTVRGGFAGTETGAGERAATSRSVVDGANARGTLLSLSIHADRRVLFERVDFTRAVNRAVAKRGLGDLAFEECSFLGNGRSQRDPGRAVFVWPSHGFAKFDVSNCVFAGQMYMSGANDGLPHGGAIYIANSKRFTADACLFATNGVAKANNGANNGGGLGSAIFAKGTPVTMRRCRIVGNCGGVKTANADGGIVYICGKSSGCAFTNCVFVGNYELRRDNNSNTKGGTLVFEPSAADATCDIEKCTFAYNLSQGNMCASALTVRSGVVNVHNSIFWKNPHGCVSATTYGCEIEAAGGTTTLSHSLVTSTDTAYCHAADPSYLSIDTATVRSMDPLFVTPTAKFDEMFTVGSSYINPSSSWTYAGAVSNDVHLLSPAAYFLNDGTRGPATASYSPAIDLGDPASDWSAEPGSNGSRVNLGAYGNTAEASETPTGQPSVESLSVAMAGEYARPRVNIVTGLASGIDYNATVTAVCSTGGVVLATKTWTGVAKGASLSWDVPCYLPEGMVAEVSVSISSEGAQDVSASGNATVSGEYPDFFGKGGGANVVHVRYGADCLGTGENWTDAFADLDSALAAVVPGKTEIWISGQIAASSLSIAASSPLALRGGFAGTENSPADRAAGSLTVLDFGNALGGFTIDNSAAVEIDRIEFLRCRTRAIAKSGVGDLALRDSVFTRCGQNALLKGRALYAEGSSAANISITNCVVRGNMTVDSNRGEQSNHGAAVYVSGCSRLFVDDSLFASNGMQLVDMTGAYDYFGYVLGAAIYADSTPVTARGTRFAANCNGNRQGGGIVFLNGNSSGSAFTNCVFSGNFERNDASNSANNYGGALCVQFSNASQTIDVESCTFAYNLTASSYASAGLNIIRGAAQVHNSIFWNNQRSRCRADGYANDIEVKAGSCAISHSILTSTEVDSCRAASGATLSIDQASVYTDDPLFVTSTDDFTDVYTINSSTVTTTSLFTYPAIGSFDVHLLSPERYRLLDGSTGPATEKNSPAIDRGDPASDWSREESPNGSRINLGAYGNTSEASATAVGQPSVESLSVGMADGYARPRATLVTGISKGSDYDATVTLVCTTGGVVLASKTFLNVKKGTTLVWNVPYYLPGGTPVSVSASIVSEGASEATGGDSATVSGEYPDFFGKGGGANVVHVRYGADCLGTGENWTDAFADFASGIEAAAASGKSEVWVAAGNYFFTSSISPEGALSVRGGFAGTENDLSERPAGAKTVLDNGETRQGLVVASGLNAPILFERLEFSGALDRAVAKTGEGDLCLVDCVFSLNGRNSPSIGGRGVYFVGGGVAKIAVTNCVFSGNMRHGASTSIGSGAGLHISNCAGADVVDSLFVTNGVAFYAPRALEIRGMSGAALYVANTKLHCRGTRFAANCAVTYNYWEGGVVMLNGNCGGSVFENCSFAGNAETLDSWSSGVVDNSRGYGGTLSIYLSSASQAVALTNCTFAYNITAARCAASGLNVARGSVKAVDCIFWGNTNGYHETEEEVAALGKLGADDILVQTEGSVALENVLLSSAGELCTRALGSGTLSGTGLVYGDALFATATGDALALAVTSGQFTYYPDGKSAALAAFNVHLRGGSGYLDETTGDFVKTYASHTVQSPALDAGRRRPTGEPHPNGGRVNLGFYGNTKWATRSVLWGTVVRIR